MSQQDFDGKTIGATNLAKAQRVKWEGGREKKKSQRGELRAQKRLASPFLGSLSTHDESVILTARFVSPKV